MVYIYGLLASYFGYIFTRQIKYSGNLFFIVGIICIGIIAVTRANVGTDTLTYEAIASTVRLGYGMEGSERGFSGLIALLQTFLDDDRVVVRALAVVYCITLLIYLRGANKNEIFYLFIFYIPVFFYQNSMNVLRIGLASNLVLLAVLYYKKNALSAMVSLFLVSILFHYSAIFLVFYCWALIGKNNKKQMFFAFFSLISILALLMYLSPEYLLQKSELYTDYQSPSSLSGLGRVLSILVLLVGVWKSNLETAIRHKISLWAILTCSGFYLLTFFSYAALRFLDLSFFALSLSIVAAYGQTGISFNRSLRYAFFLSGLIAFAASYRGWLAAFGLEGSPFLPYKSLWWT